MTETGKVLCVCISAQSKSSKQNVHECKATLQGLVGEVHYGKGRKHVSMLPYEKVKEFFDGTGQPILYGRFGENLLVEGLDWDAIRKGDRFRCGEVLLEVVRIDANCPAADAYQGEKVCTPMEPYFVFCQILQEGMLCEGQQIMKENNA